MLFDLFFYKLYVGARSNNKPCPKYAAISYISFLLSINYFAIHNILLITELFPILNQYGPYIIFFVFFCIFIYLSNRYNRSKVITILKKYKSVSKNQKIVGTVILIAYILFTFLISFYVTRLRIKIRNSIYTINISPPTKTLSYLTPSKGYNGNFGRNAHTAQVAEETESTVYV